MVQDKGQDKEECSCAESHKTFQATLPLFQQGKDQHYSYAGGDPVYFEWDHWKKPLAQDKCAKPQMNVSAAPLQVCGHQVTSIHN